MQNYQQLDLQALIDLLANETQEYTRAFTSGVQNEVALRKTIIDSLISEIRSRQKEAALPPTVPEAIIHHQSPGTDPINE